MNLTELNKIAEATRLKLGGQQQRICVCAGASCMSSGAQGVLDATTKALKAAGLDKDVQAVPVGCMGACNAGPLLKVDGDGTVYQKVDADKGVKVVERHLKTQAVMTESLLFAETGKATPKAEDMPFYKKQVKVVLENCGTINPESIEEYIAKDGYLALNKALGMQPEDVIGEMKASGLRGRGGGGFPTGNKWETVYRHVADQKYVICNGDEGDPGAFMDRSVLEGDPHRILEGMAIAGYAVGATRGFLYVRGEYPLAIKRLENAIKQARKTGLLGKNILESAFDFDVEIRIGAGAFVCGEETALIASIEGKRGTPKPRPPYPAESGLWGKPTLINNVESFAAVAPIIQKGAEWYSAIGTPKSPGTKVFALAGTIANTGLIEVPMGTSLREIIYEIGGGIPGGKRFKAAQTGGPSGGCIPEQFLDTKVDYESLSALGSIMGSGGLIVMDESSCMPAVARYFMEFCMDESCGKCIPCRVGTKQMHGLLDKICRGEGSLRDLELLEELAPMVKETSLCGLGMSAPNPLLSTLRYFRDEYLAHINEKRCPAGTCKMHATAGVK
jgi:NADH:ubiquinone oxidoreductase subunit F (NADH-binding)/(2Fe-2S) ferredoxin